MVREASLVTPTSPEDPEHFDVIVAGTSPMCMVTALAERADGKRVLVVDGADEVGGTWKTTELLGYTNVELGCHQLDAIRAVYRLFEDLGIPLAVMEPQPILVSVEPSYFPRRLVFHHRWLRELHDVFSGTTNYDLYWVDKRSMKSRLRGALRAGRQASRALRGGRRPAKYPPNGAMDIVRRLDDLARQAGIEIRLATWLSDIALDRDSDLVRFRLNGVMTTASRVHLTSSSNIGPIVDGDDVVDVNTVDSCWQTLYLSLVDCPKPPFSYAVFTNPKLLHRASDLSRYALPSEDVPDARLIALTINEDAPETESTAIEALLRMQECGLIDRNARLRDFTYLPYSFTRIDEWNGKELENRLRPLISLHETSLLTPSVNNLMRRGNYRELMARVCGQAKPWARVPS
jgi:hypothetical protein